MRFNKLDLNLLVALDALLTEQSISRAAEKIHLSQPAMSNALARLREHFDDELLIRVGRRMDLSLRAEGLKDPVRDVLVRIDATLSHEPEFRPERSDRLFRLLVSDYTTTTLMPHVLALAYRAAPRVRFELHPQVAHPQRPLERGEADLLIIPTNYCSPEHPVDIVLEETFCCVLWAQSALTIGPMTVERYMSAGHVVVRPTDGEPATENWFMRPLALDQRIEAFTYGFASPAHLIVGTDRIATMHRRLAEAAIRSLPVAIRELPFEVPKMKQAVQWHSHRTRDPGLVWLRGLVRTAVGMMDAS